MGLVGAQIQASAVISLGDNFYFEGVKDQTSHRFEDTWNSVYTADELQVPWYLIGGNHDHYGNITAQVEYSGHAERWNFPDLYHTKSFVSELDGTTVDVIFIDTVDLAGNSEVHDESDPKYYDPLPHRERGVAATQWDWIEAQLAASTADHILVAGHYPVYSVCSHGPTSNLITNLQPMLIQYGAHYFAGHDHCLESFKDENNLLYIVSGAGNTCCTNDEHKEDVPAEYIQWYVSGKNFRDDFQGGFNSVTASADAGLVVSFWDQDGGVMYSTSAVAARSQELKQKGKK